MNKVINKFFSAGDIFMPEMHLREAGFTYSSCGPFPKNKERIKKFKESRDSKCIYQKELHKACFQHDMAYGDFKELTRRTAADKLLRNKAFNIAKNATNDGFQRGLASIVYKFFDKKTSGGTVKSEIILNQQIAKELHEPIIRKSEKRKVHSSFKYNIWGADLAGMQLTSKFNKILYDK